MDKQTLKYYGFGLIIIVFIGVVFWVLNIPKTNSDNDLEIYKEPINIKIDTTKTKSSSNYETDYNKKTEEEVFHIIQVAFDNAPSEAIIKKYLDPVILYYKETVDNNTRLRFANVLVALRKERTKNYTEMHLLKHIYLYGSNKISFAKQAGISATLFETME